MYSRLLKLDKLYGAQNYKSLQVILQRGKGVHVTDIEGKEYYDFLSTYSSVNQGHCHPRLVKVMKDQCEKLTLCSRAFYNENLCNFFEYMHKKFGYDKSLPMNTGVEASETAIKLARLWGYKTKKIPQDKAEFIVARNNFWGRSIAACSSSTDPSCFTNFGPFVPGFHFVDFNNLQELEYVLKTRPNVVGFMVEPIQGEAGIQIPDDDYLVKAKMLCEKYNCLLICDEVQTGIGRTGNMLASHTIKPDMVVLGKALSGGMMPVSCVLGDNKVMDLIDPGTHGSTYGGNPLGTSIVPHAVDIIESEGLLENAEKQGKLFRDELKIFVDLGVLKDVRGKGLLNAIELHDEGSANELVNKMMNRGLLTKVTREGTIRMCPPLVISDIEMDNSLNIIRRCLSDL